jgi:type II secretory pathway component PulC
MVRYVSWLINSALFTLCCFLVADTANAIISALLSQAPPVAVTADPVARAQSREWNERQKIINRNLFHSSDLAADAAIPEPEPEEDLEETELPLKLWGTIASLDPEQSWASIEDLNERTTTTVRVGDEINHATIVGIDRQQVILLENGKRRSLSLEDADSTGSISSAESLRASARSRRSESRQPSARASRSTTSSADSARQSMRDRIRKLAEDNFEVEADDVAKAMKDPSELLQNAAFLPKLNPDGKLEGIEISAIQPGSFLEEIGIGNGEIITQIDGVPIGHFKDLSQIPAALQSALSGGDGTTITVKGPHGPRDLQISSP